LRKKDGATALGFAQKYPAIVEMLKAKGAKVASNQALDIELMAAAGKGDLAKVKDLVEKGAYPNYHDTEGRTPLIEAVYGGHAEVVKFLLEKGADPNARKNDGAAAIGFAKKYPAIVEMLKAAGAKE
jgi:ankyrin repeat protein